MQILLTISCFFSLLVFTCTKAGAESYPLDPGPNGNPIGWRLHNARTSTFDGGEKRGVILPDTNPGEFSKLFHREEFEPGSIDSIKVKALVRGVGVSDTGEAGRLRIFFSKPGGEFRGDSIVWPAGKAGSYTPIASGGGEWREVSFKMDAPLSAGEWEVAVESKDPQRSVEVAGIEIEKKLIQVKTKEIRPEDRKNLLAGTTTRFEGGLAGWQVFILPHWPAVQLDPEFVSSNPGEGLTSLRLAPGTGLNSMPVLPASGYGILSFSLLARASAEGKLVVRIGQNDGQFQDEVFPVGPAWQRFTAHFRVPADRGIPYIFIENRGDGLGNGPDIFIDGLSLIPGITGDYISPPEELVLTRAPGKPVEARLRFINQSEAGICVFRNSLAGRFTMQSIRLFSTSALRISPSPDVLLVSEPLAKTKPACPLGAK